MMITEYEFEVPGAKCGNCSSKILESLTDSETKGITAKRFELTAKTLIITTSGEVSDLDVQDWVATRLYEKGFRCTVKNSKLNPNQSNLPEENFFIQFIKSRWLWGALALLSGAILIILSLLGITLPLGVMVALGIFSTIFTLGLGWESYYEAVHKLVKAQTLTMDSLFAISTLVVLVVSLSAFFVPWLPMMFEAGLLIFGFRHLGIAVEEGIKNSTGVVQTFKDRLPANVLREHNKSTEEIPLAMVKPNDILVLKSGDLIPVDGICECECLIYDTIATGSILPRKVQKGEKVLAGMYLAEETTDLKLRVTAAAKNSYLARLDSHVNQANDEKAPLQTIADTILQYFIPAVILFAITSAVIVSIFFPPALAIKCGIAVLVSACPCTLGFIIPLAIKIGMNKAAEYGVKFKSSKALQEADYVDTVVFDLNGTLTKGIPSVVDYKMVSDGIQPHEMLAICADLEKNSHHPIAKAICQFVREKEIHSLVSFSEEPKIEHCGLKAKTNEHKYVIGNQEMMEKNNIKTEESNKSIVHECGDSVIYLARDQKIIGYLLIRDPLKEDARDTIAHLKKLGKQVFICTGADEATAKRYAQRLAINEANVRAACRGSDEVDTNSKKEFIDELKKQDKIVAMIGDAGNDAAAIAASNFGIAIESPGGDILTQQEAGAVIQSGSLLPVVTAFEVAKQTNSNIKENMGIGFIYNLFVMGFLASGLSLLVGIAIHPAVGVALMIIQSTIMLLNALYFKQQELEHLNIEPDKNYSSSYQELNRMLKNDLDNKLENEPRHSTLLQPPTNNINIHSQLHTNNFSFEN